MKEHIVAVLIVFSVCVLIAGVILFAVLNNGHDKKDTEDTIPEPEIVDFSELNAVFLGDSITFGELPKVQGGGRMNEPYPTVVANILGLNSSQNLGKSWSTLTRTLTCRCHNKPDAHNPMVLRCQELPTDVQIIGIMGGTNDSNVGAELGDVDSVDPYEIYGALNLIATTLKENHPDAFIFFMTPLYEKDENEKNVFGETKFTKEDVRNAVIEVAEKHGIPCLETHIFADFVDLANDASMTDGVHPTQEFVYETLAPVIAEFIEYYYGMTEN